MNKTKIEWHFITRMHSSRMHTTRSLTVSPYLIIFHACPPPRSNHACPPRATMHAPIPPRGTTHAPPWEQPCMPPKQPHTPLEQPCTPPRATMHAPQEQPRMPPQSNHACPHPPEQPRMPPTPGATTHAPPVNRITDRCKNITFANYVCGR